MQMRVAGCLGNRAGLNPFSEAKPKAVSAAQ